MRGFPLFNLLIMLAVVLALTLPLGWISGARTTVEATAPPKADAAQIVGTNIGIRLAHPAEAASLWLGEKLVQEWKPAVDGQRLEARLELPMNESAMEFEVRLKWPENTPQTVAEISVEPDGMPARQTNLWARGHTEEVIHFNWKTTP